MSEKNTHCRTCPWLLSKNLCDTNADSRSDCGS